MRHLLCLLLLCSLGCSGNAAPSGPRTIQTPKPQATAEPVVTPTPQPELAQLELALRKDFVPKVRPGFKVTRWAEVRRARSLAVSPDGKYVFAGTQGRRVFKITVGKEPKVEEFQDDLNAANGVTFSGSDLLVAERDKVLKFSSAKGFPLKDKGQVLVSGMPNDGHHGWRYIKAGPDGRVAIGIGAPCNVCVKEDPRFGSICSFAKDGSDFRVIAHGVRNTVGFDWHPDSGVFYFTDNGRDWLGDDIPPCELNSMTKEEEGSHYGFPYRWGDNQLDPEFGKKAPEGLSFTAPIVEFQAHVAPLGCHFPRHKAARKALPNQLVVAQHGSWNRSSPVGYQVVTVDFGKNKKVEPWLWGFLDPVSKRGVHGRPVDVAELADGSLLVSDDLGGVIWRIEPK